MSYSASHAFNYFRWQYWHPSGVNAEFDPSQANAAAQNARALLIGQITSTGATTSSSMSRPVQHRTADKSASTTS